MSHPKDHPYYIRVSGALRANGLNPEKEDILIQDILSNLFHRPLDIRNYTMAQHGIDIIGDENE